MKLSHQTPIATFATAEAANLRVDHLKSRHGDRLSSHLDVMHVGSADPSANGGQP